MYTEDAVAHNTVLKEMEDKSQLQAEPCAERQETNKELHTTGEGQLLWKYNKRQFIDTLMCILAHEILKLWLHLDSVLES